MPKSLAISNPTCQRFQVARISNHCNFSCDFYKIFHRFRWFRLRFHSRSAIWNRVILHTISNRFDYDFVIWASKLMCFLGPLSIAYVQAWPCEALHNLKPLTINIVAQSFAPWRNVMSLRAIVRVTSNCRLDFIGFCWSVRIGGGERKPFSESSKPAQTRTSLQEMPQNRNKHAQFRTSKPPLWAQNRNKLQAYPNSHLLVEDPSGGPARSRGFKLPERCRFRFVRFLSFSPLFFFFFRVLFRLLLFSSVFFCFLLFSSVFFCFLLFSSVFFMVSLPFLFRFLFFVLFSFFFSSLHLQKNGETPFARPLLRPQSPGRFGAHR